MHKEFINSEDIKTVFVKAEGGAAGAKQAFSKLESHFPTLRGRKFYGVVKDGVYMACTKIQPDEKPENLYLETYTIPGGRYIKTKIKDWTKNIENIAVSFNELASTNSVDENRPFVEFYKSFQDLVIMIPVK